jgi:hypothetical protein
MSNEPINFKRDKNLIKKYLDISKPNGVSKISFELTPTGDEKEYYMRIIYIVPNDSKYLKDDPRNSIHVNYRYEWNNLIKKDIYDFFGLKIIISNSGTRSEKFNKG